MVHRADIADRPFFAAVLSGRGLDVIKIVAAISMLVDHAGYILFGGGLYFYLIGRLAFPLFCFAAAAAILRLRDDPAHLYRQAGLLLLFALLTEPVSQLARSGYQAINVLFTLSLAMAVAPVMLRLPAWFRALVYVTGIAAMSYPNAWEFGFAGMLLPVAMALALSGRRCDMGAALALAAVTNFGGYAALAGVRADLVIATLVCAVLAPVAVLYAVSNYYNARPAPGRVLWRYALHLFYPAHMLVLWLAGMAGHALTAQ